MERKGRGFSPPTDFHCAAWGCQLCRVRLICAARCAARHGSNQNSASPRLKVAALQKHTFPVICAEMLHLLLLSLRRDGSAVGVSQTRVRSTRHLPIGVSCDPRRTTAPRPAQAFSPGLVRSAPPFKALPAALLQAVVSGKRKRLMRPFSRICQEQKQRGVKILK